MAVNMLNAHIYDISEKIDASALTEDYEIPNNLNDGFYVGNSSGNLVVETSVGNDRTVPVTSYMTIHMKCSKIKTGGTITDLYLLRMKM